MNATNSDGSRVGDAKSLRLVMFARSLNLH